MSGQGPGLTVIALAWNEGGQLRACFRSLAPLVELTEAETLIVLDAEADDCTAGVAREVAQRVEVSRFVDFATQRNRALQLATTDWVFFIDADERCTPRLAHEIARAVRREDCAAFRVPRRNFLFGREVRFTGWWPDYQVRLLRRGRAHYDERRKVHEYPVIEGDTCTLLNPLTHYNYETWGQFVRKQRAYAPLEAQVLYQEGHRARLRGYAGQPVREFKRRFFDYQGYRDGLLGFALSVAMAIYRAETYRLLGRLQRQGSR